MRGPAVPVCLLVIALAGGLRAQTPPVPAPAPAAATDPLGRDTPRGTVLGFLQAGGAGDDERASRYLATSLAGPQAHQLSRQLYVVLDARLPARLLKISDAPEGARRNPDRPDQELIGTIASEGHRLDVVVERVTIAAGARVWLFSEATLAGVPRAYEEVTLGWGDSVVGRGLAGLQLRRARFLEWLVLAVVAALAYGAIVLLNRLLAALRGRSRRDDTAARARSVLPLPLRLLFVAAILQWFLSTVPMSLLVRQIGWTITSLAVIVAVVWLLIVLNGVGERLLRQRVPAAGTVAGAALLHLLRRCADVVMVVGGLIATLRVFAIDPTPALAGLGVGGIAIALAAQKTLENVIAGASLVFDQAVRVGDVLRMGEVTGTVEHIGLRSTRIRTPDRTVVTVPNSQIASVSLETLSARDKFWFHPIVSLHHDTPADQLHQVVEGLKRLLETHAAIEKDSIGVRFIRVGVSSLDVEVVAYVLAPDWAAFVAIQQELLFAITDIVSQAGTRIALPAQAMYVADAKAFVQSATKKEQP